MYAPHFSAEALWFLNTGRLHSIDYELVRIHHPDSAHSRSLPPSERHTRFQSITAAYDVLQGKRRGGMPGDVGGGGSGPWGTSDPYMDELDRRRRAHYARHNRHAEYTHYTRHDGWTASADDRWKDRMILIVGIIVSAALPCFSMQYVSEFIIPGQTLMAGIAPGLFIVPERMGKMHKAAVANLNQAREEARELGDERRSRMRERVKGMKCKNREAEEEQQLGEKAG